MIVRDPSAGHPLAFGSYRSWMRLLRDNGGVDHAFRDRARLVSLASLCTLPLRLYERARYASFLDSRVLQAPPIFIIGHWRSGTTHLHNLMCTDVNLGYVTTFQTLAPDACLSGKQTIKRLLARFMPTTRMMDNMALSLDGPQEEEFALANMSPHSFYHHWSFPRAARSYFDKYALFRQVSHSVVQEWKALYLTMLRKATHLMDGRQLVLKNPTNMGRIPLLLDLFPNAKFVHIYRNPYHIFPSTYHFYSKTLPTTQLQQIGLREIEANILSFYQAIIRKFWADKALIPPQNLVEVRFEDLEAQPYAEVGRMYEQLGLPRRPTAHAALQSYIKRHAEYQKNRFPIDRATAEKVDAHWNFAVEAWKYTVPR
jgi:hypothetical protein